MSTTSERNPMRFEDALLSALIDALRDQRENDVAALLSQTTPPKRRSRWVIAGPIVAAALGLALVGPVLLPNGPGGADPAAAALLHRVAFRAARQPAQAAPTPGQYLYTKSVSTQMGLYVVGDGTTFFFEQPTTRESWIGPDGSGRIRSTWGKVTFPTEEGRAKWIAAGSPDLYENLTEDETFDHGELAPSDYTDLPVDPEELLELIESRELIGGPSGDWETFAIIGNLLRETYTQPKVRAALYQVAAELPGIELVGRVEDGAGRPGMAVAYTRTNSDAPFRHELIFDPKTAELLGENQVLVADSTVDVESGGPGAIYGGVGPAGMRAYTTTYMESGVVDSTSESL